MSDDVIGLIVTLDAIDIEFCALRHETNAVLAAEGYAAATGGLGIAIIGRGPALANAMHGLVNAARGGSRVLVISGDAEPDGGPLCPDYKRFDAAGALRLTGFDVVRASAADEARGAFARAVRCASAGTDGTTIAAKRPEYFGLDHTIAGDRSDAIGGRRAA